MTNGQKTVLSGNRKGSIKQTNTSQVLVSETVPDRRVQPSRRAKMTRFGDNPGSSQPSSNALSPETSSSASTSRSTSPELLEMERSFNSLLAGTRDRQSHPVMRSQMDNLRDQQQRIAVLKQVASQPQNQPRPVSAPPVANMPLPPYPRRRPSDKGSKNQVQAENANAPRKSSDSETDYRTFKKSLVDALDHPVSRNWPNSSRLHQMKRRTAMSTTGRDARSSLSRRGRRRVKNKHCNLTLKT